MNMPERKAFVAITYIFLHQRANTDCIAPKNGRFVSANLKSNPWLAIFTTASSHGLRTTYYKYRKDAGA